MTLMSILPVLLVACRSRKNANTEAEQSFPAVISSGMLVGEISAYPSICGKKPHARPEAIQPIVPITRMRGKSRSTSGTLAKAMLLVSAMVGI